MPRTHVDVAKPMLLREDPYVYVAEDRHEPRKARRGRRPKPKAS